MKYLFALLVAASVMGTGLRAENWPQWRGPRMDGISSEKGLPSTWGPEQNVLWKVPMPGMGCATPAVWGDRLFVTSEDGENIVLLCIGTDGKVLWKNTIGAAIRKARGDEGNGATASPCTDGKHVWAFAAGSGDLVCLDFDGKQVWSFNIQKKYGRFSIQFGMHSSPLLHGDRIYLATLHRGGEWIIALDKGTGNVAWKVDRKGDGIPGTESPDGYASPMIWTKGNEAMLIVHGNDTASAHKLEDGKEVWRVGDLNSTGRRDWRFVASPGVSEDVIIIPTCKDGVTVAIRADATGEMKAGASGELWRVKYTTDVPTPLIHDGLVYMVRAQGQVVCLDAKTGKEFYSERGYNARHRASPVLADGKIYIVARDGTINVIQVGKEYKLLAKNRLPDEIAASPAIAGGRIYLRGFKDLYAIGTK